MPEIESSPSEELSNEDLVAHLVKFAPEQEEYVRFHFERFRNFFAAIPAGSPDKKLLDVGGLPHIVPVYTDVHGYGVVSILNKWMNRADGEKLKQAVDPDRLILNYTDAEIDDYPYEDGFFDIVVSSELLEHLSRDPMRMMSEINRVLRKGGRLVLTTPNITSFNALFRLFSGKHPQMWSQYTYPLSGRHNREYTAEEVRRLLKNAGFDEVQIRTFSLDPPTWKDKLILTWFSLPWLLRGDTDSLKNKGSFVLATCVKAGPVRDRYPEWLYRDETGSSERTLAH